LPRGFTLLELIIVIIILGILAVTVTPKFFSSNGFSEYAYRADAIAKLRLIQTKAMQQAVKRVSNCHRVLVTSKRLGAPDDCDDSPSFTSDWQETATGLVVDIDDTVTFSSNIPGNNFTFDSLGRPDSCGPCDITIIGEQEIKLRIESEGYIHAL
jgi:MSHA pilin protein MshC